MFNVSVSKIEITVLLHTYLASVLASLREMTHVFLHVVCFMLLHVGHSLTTVNGKWMVGSRKGFGSVQRGDVHALLKLKGLATINLSPAE